MPKLTRNNTIFNLREDVQDILKFIEENTEWYSNSEMIDLVRCRFGYDIGTDRNMSLIMQRAGIKGIRSPKFVKVMIESTYRFMSIIIKRELQKKKEGKRLNDRQERQIQEKLDRLKAMDKRKEERYESDV